MRAVALLVVLLFAAGAAPASRADQSRVVASLHAEFDAGGSISITFDGPGSLAEDATARLLADAFSCATGDFARDRARNVSVTAVHLHGICAASMARSGELFSGSWDLAPLMALLRATRVGRFDLILTYPGLEIGSVSPPLRTRTAGNRQVYSAYWLLDQGRGPRVVSLAYGFGSRDVLYRMMAVAVVLLTITSGVALVAARWACGNADRAAGWFGYVMLAGITNTISFLVWVAGMSADHLPARIWIELDWAGPARYALLPLLLLLPILIGELITRQATVTVGRRIRGWQATRLGALGRSLLQMSGWTVMLLAVMFAVDLPRDLSSDAQLGGFIAAMLALVVVLNIRRRVLGIRLRALPEGELRRRIEALAAAHGVRFRNIRLVSGPATDVFANAFVQPRGIVLYTEPLLRQLSRREVDAVTLAEIGRVKLHHVPIILALTAVYVGLICLAAYYFRGALSLAAFPAAVLLLAVLRNHILRRLCLARDRLCGRLSDDPVGMISALVRLAESNGEPLNRPAWQTWLTTHPPMTVRIEAIAEAARLTEEQIRLAPASARAEPGERYAVEPAAPRPIAQAAPGRSEVPAEIGEAPTLV